jgi:hypothetical protein
LEKELDNTMGIRFEYMPAYLPGLNIGFVLNDWNTTVKSGAVFKDLLQESVLGLSYTHDYFHLRFAWRLDSDGDEDLKYNTDNGHMMVYRLEERVLKNYLPGMQIWATGYFEELLSGDENDITAENRLYIQYDPDNFTAELRLGYNFVNLRPLGYTIDDDLIPLESSWRYFFVWPSFYYKLFDNFLSVGAAFEFAKCFGSDIVVSDSFLYWYVEPEIRLNIGSGTYLALVYRYQEDFLALDRENHFSPFNSKSHWANLRVVFTF